MKSSDLHTIWSAPDNSRLTSKQFSFRFPTHVAAKLQALCDLYPSRTRTQIVGDLLTAAMGEVEKSLPQEVGEFLYAIPGTDELVYEDVGPRNRYRILSNKYFLELEKELGNEEAKPLFESECVVTDHETLKDQRG